MSSAVLFALFVILRRVGYAFIRKRCTGEILGESGVDAPLTPYKLGRFLSYGATEAKYVPETTTFKVTTCNFANGSKYNQSCFASGRPNVR